MKKSSRLMTVLGLFHPDETVTLHLTGEQANVLLTMIEQPTILMQRGVWCEATEKTWASIGHYLQWIRKHVEPVFPEDSLPW